MNHHNGPPSAVAGLNLEQHPSSGLAACFGAGHVGFLANTGQRIERYKAPLGNSLMTEVLAIFRDYKELHGTHRSRSMFFDATPCCLCKRPPLALWPGSDRRSLEPFPLDEQYHAVMMA